LAEGVNGGVSVIEHLTRHLGQNQRWQSLQLGATEYAFGK